MIKPQIGNLRFDIDILEIPVIIPSIILVNIPTPFFHVPLPFVLPNVVTTPVYILTMEGNQANAAEEPVNAWKPVPIEIDVASGNGNGTAQGASSQEIEIDIG